MDASTTEVVATDLVDNTSEVLYFTNYLIGSVLLIILFMIHSYKVGLDLCTKERKSVAHRRNRPEITREYKQMRYLTLSCIFFYMAYDIGGWVQMIDYSPEQCRSNLITWTFSWTLSKGLMYCIYLLRLHQVFGGSAYGYNKWIIYSILTVNLLSAVLIPILVHIFTSEHVLIIDQDKFPNPCFVVLLQWIYVWFLSWDIVMNILCLALFINPLTRSLRAISHSVRDVTSVQKMSKKMIYVGIKCTIIAAVTSTSSLIAVLLVIVGQLQFLYPFDFVVNAASVMLITPYYPDSIYYEKLCKGCLLLCPVEYRSESNYPRNLKQNVESKDTMDVPNYAANIPSPTTSPASIQENTITDQQMSVITVGEPAQE